MSKELSRVTNRELKVSVSEAQSISVESPEWFEWLAANKSFRFGYDLEDGFTALKNSRGYWYAQRRVSGTLHQKCLGKDEKITWEAMTEANKALTLMAIDHRAEDRMNRHLKSGLVQAPVQTLTEETSPSGEEIERLKAEVARLTKHESYLLEQLDLVKSQIINEAQERVKELREIKVIDRSQLRISSKTNDYYRLRGEAVVFLSDLEQMGFTIR